MQHLRTFIFLFLLVVLVKSEKRIKRSLIGQRKTRSIDGPILRKSQEIEFIRTSSGNDTENAPKEGPIRSVPKTLFTCRDKDVLGFYADVETNCSVYHLCTVESKESFVCPEGKYFDQSLFRCTATPRIKCADSRKFFKKNDLFLRAFGYDVPDFLPKTSFSCDNVPFLPGFYADEETKCTIFHLCRKHPETGLNTTYSFACIGGRKFNQRIHDCDLTENVNCSKSSKYYSSNTNIDILGYDSCDLSQIYEQNNCSRTFIYPTRNDKKIVLENEKNAEKISDELSDPDSPKISSIEV